MRVEASPFHGWFTSFGGNSADSVAGILHTGRRSDPANRRRDILKWNRQDIPSEEDAEAIAEFKERSVVLYKEALGPYFIVPTGVIAGLKKDQNSIKHKVYQVQPIIDGISAKDAPDELRRHPEVLTQWRIMSERLYGLYSVADEVNSQFAEECRFPITMTVGSSRKNSFCQESSEKLPQTKNIIIRQHDLQLQLFDFGEYVPWRECMQDAYDMILRATHLPRDYHVYPIADMRLLEGGGGE